MLKGCVQNLKRAFADPVVGMAAFTVQIRQLVLQYRKLCLIDNPSPNSLFAANDTIKSALLVPGINSRNAAIEGRHFGLLGLLWLPEVFIEP